MNSFTKMLNHSPVWRDHWVLVFWGKWRIKYPEWSFLFLILCFHLSNHSGMSLQSRTKVLTHLSKTNAFYPRPCVNSNNIFFTYSLAPSPPFQCWNTLRWHCHVVTILKGGEGIEKWKLDIEKLTRSSKQVFFGEGLNCFCPWLKEQRKDFCSSAFTVRDHFLESTQTFLEKRSSLNVRLLNSWQISEPVYKYC